MSLLIKYCTRDGHLLTNRYFNFSLLLPSRQHVVLGFVGLEHLPHASDVIVSMPPITFGVDIPQGNLLLDTSADLRTPSGHLLRDERAAATRRLVVEEDACIQGLGLSHRVDRL
jgi:hypothetical protein